MGVSFQPALQSIVVGLDIDIIHGKPQDTSDAPSQGHKGMSGNSIKNNIG